MIKKVIVIAEAGVNHNGSVETAKKLILAAKKAGADIVKFQTYKAENIVTNNVKSLDYQKINAANSKITQFELLKSLELKEQDFEELKDYSNKVGIDFLTTVFGLESINFLEKLNLNYTKIPSGEMLNVPYLRRVSKIPKPIFLSTGMADLEEIAFSIKILTDSDFPSKKITLLHCITMYPTPIHLSNISALQKLKEKFGLNVGLSDHTESIEIPILAIGFGCRVIEKHLTLDNNQIGPDHKASLNPLNMEKMIKNIRNMEMALGDGIKQPNEEEKVTANLVRPKIICRTPITKGEVIAESKLTTLRANDGIDARYWDSIVNKIAQRSFIAGEPIE